MLRRQFGGLGSGLPSSFRCAPFPRQTSATLPLDSAAFINPVLVEKFYPNNDFHVMYVGEIVNVYRK
jgi:hypothetical protein